LQNQNSIKLLKTVAVANAVQAVNLLAKQVAQWATKFANKKFW